MLPTGSLTGSTGNSTVWAMGTAATVTSLPPGRRLPLHPPRGRLCSTGHSDYIKGCLFACICGVCDGMFYAECEIPKGSNSVWSNTLVTLHRVCASLHDVRAESDGCSQHYGSDGPMGCAHASHAIWSRDVNTCHPPRSWGNPREHSWERRCTTWKTGCWRHDRQTAIANR